jgi:surfactin synthase thioesterase subunit
MMSAFRMRISIPKFVVFHWLWLLSLALAAPCQAAPSISFRNEEPLAAYSPENPSQQIGTFQPGSELEVADPRARSDNFYEVSFKQPDGSVIKALCLKSDIELPEPTLEQKNEKGDWLFNGTPIVEGKTMKFQAPLSPEATSKVEEKENIKATEASAAIAFPKGFDPSKPWPILAISATSDGSASSVKAMGGFVSTAVASGWIVIAADGPQKAKKDTLDWRWAMLSSAMDLMHKQWPQSRQWPVACAGHSGGAKRSAYIAALFLKHKYTVTGLFMNGINQESPISAWDYVRPPAAYKKIPMFLSGGNADKIADPKAHKKIQGMLKDASFKQVELDIFEGGHTVSKENLKRALSWFMEVHLASGKDATGK